MPKARARLSGAQDKRQRRDGLRAPAREEDGQSCGEMLPGLSRVRIWDPPACRVCFQHIHLESARGKLHQRPFKGGNMEGQGNPELPSRGRG